MCIRDRSGIQELAPGIDPPNRWSYSAGASMSYQLDLFGQIRRAVEAAGADAQAAQAAYDATRVTVAAETARAYANLCSAGMQLASAEHSVKVQQESLDAVSRLQRAGRGTALDVTRAQMWIRDSNLAARHYFSLLLFYDANMTPVSYTHLDLYKRQPMNRGGYCTGFILDT